MSAYRSRKILTEYVKVCTNWTVLVEIHELSSLNSYETWIDHAHVQEIVTLLRPTMEDRVGFQARLGKFHRRKVLSEEKSAESKKMGRFYQPKVLTGDKVRISYCFRKRDIAQKCMMRKFVGNGGRFVSYLVLRDKLVVHAYHLPGYLEMLKASLAQKNAGPAQPKPKKLKKKQNEADEVQGVSNYFKPGSVLEEDTMHQHTLKNMLLKSKPKLSGSGKGKRKLKRSKLDSSKENSVQGALTNPPGDNLHSEIMSTSAGMLTVTSTVALPEVNSRSVTSPDGASLAIGPSSKSPQQPPDSTNTAEAFRDKPSQSLKEADKMKIKTDVLPLIDPQGLVSSRTDFAKTDIQNALVQPLNTENGFTSETLLQELDCEFDDPTGKIGSQDSCSDDLGKASLTTTPERKARSCKYKMQYKGLSSSEDEAANLALPVVSSCDTISATVSTSRPSCHKGKERSKRLAELMESDSDSEPIFDNPLIKKPRRGKVSTARCPPESKRQKLSIDEAKPSERVEVTFKKFKFTKKLNLGSKDHCSTSRENASNTATTTTASTLEPLWEQSTSPTPPRERSASPTFDSNRRKSYRRSRMIFIDKARRYTLTGFHSPGGATEQEELFSDCYIQEALSTMPDLIQVKMEGLNMMDDIHNTRKVSALTEQQLTYLVKQNERYLRDIFQGKTPCRRHDDFKKGGTARVDLAYQMPIGRFTDDQCDHVMELMLQMFCKSHNKYLDYVMKVMQPEMLIKIYMDAQQVGHKYAEKQLSDSHLESDSE